MSHFSLCKVSLSLRVGVGAAIALDHFKSATVTGKLEEILFRSSVLTLRLRVLECVVSLTL